MIRLIAMILSFFLLTALSGCYYVGMDDDKADAYEKTFLAQLAEYQFDDYWINLTFAYSTDEELDIQIEMRDGEPSILIQSTDECVLYKEGVEKRFCVATGEETVTEVNWRDYDFITYVDQAIDFVRAFDGTADNRGAREIPSEDGPSDIDIMYSYYDADFPFQEDLSLIFFLQDDNGRTDDDPIEHVDLQNHMTESLEGNDSIYAKFYLHGELESYDFEKVYQYYLDGDLPESTDENQQTEG